MDPTWIDNWAKMVLMAERKKGRSIDERPLILFFF
jgi:hypothetical protein